MPNKRRRPKTSRTSKRSNKRSQNSAKAWQISITTTAGGEDAVGALLERLFNVTPVVYCDEATGARIVSVYPRHLGFKAPSARAKLGAELGKLRAGGLKAGKGGIVVKQLASKSWADSWKHHFTPIDIDGVLLIKPRWILGRGQPGQHVVILNPGMSFGTGHHPTTLFCLQRLIKCRIAGQSQSFLDIGTGSGILAIAAAKLGYGPVDAFDNDPVAVRVCRTNIRRNRAFHQVQAQQKDLTQLHKKVTRRYAVICANLVRDLLVSEASTICARLKPGGKLIVAGILRRQFADVEKSLRRFNLTLQVKKLNRTWQSGEFVLRGPASEKMHVAGAVGGERNRS